MAFTTPSAPVDVPYRETSPGQIFWVPGDPGVTYTKGLRYTMSGGVAIAASDSATGCFLICAETTVCAAATVAFEIPALFDPSSTSRRDCLVPFMLDVSKGLAVKHKIVNYADETVTSWTASTRTLVVGTGFGANDYPNGALAYVYDGPGAGEVNVVEDYVHGSLAVVFHRPFNATLTTDSKIIILGSTAGANALGPFGRCDLYSSSSDMDVIDGADDGDYVAMVDWKESAALLAAGHLYFARASMLY